MFLPTRKSQFANPEESYFTNSEGSQFGGLLFSLIRRGPIFPKSDVLENFLYTAQF